MNDLRELQLVELAILKETISVLERNHLSYYALGGTMLGSVRHKGFVPWDDDIDIGLPRDDYERLFDIKDQFPKHIKLLSFRYDPSYPYYITRIVDERVIVRSDRTEGAEITPAWIDVFPLDGMPNHQISRKLHEKRILISRTLFQISRFHEVVNIQRTNRPLWEKLFIQVAQRVPIQKMIGKDYAFQLFDRVLKSCPYHSSDYNINAIGAHRLKEEFRKEIFGEGALYPFEDIQIRGPVDYEAYLTQLYRDWRTPSDFTHHGNIEVIRSASADSVSD